MHRRPITTALIAGAGLLAVAALTACNGGQAAQTQSEVPGGPGIAITTGAGSEPGSGDAGTGTTGGTTRAQLRADSITETPVPLRIDVVRLRATGDLVDLELRLTNEADPGAGERKSPSFKASSLFADGQNSYDISAIGLVDPRARKLYLPAFDSDNDCLCTDSMGANEYEAGGSYTLTATYGGVPRDLDVVDVRIPHFPAVVGVRIAR
jgi:hypothetical protein